MVKQRIEFIDLAKGLCIIMVVMFHCGFNDVLPDFLIHLRMPLYFFLSGIFFKDYGGVLKTVLRKIDRLIVPALFFVAITSVFVILANVRNHGNWMEPGTFFYDFFVRLRIQPAVWFLTCLFCQNLIFVIICRSTRNTPPLQFLCVLVVTIFGIVLSANRIELPLYLDTAMTALPFFYMGYRMKTTVVLMPNQWDKYNLILAALFMGLSIGIGYLFIGEVEYAHNILTGNILMHYIQSCFAIMGFILFCKAIKRIPGVSFIGRYSIIVLGIHQCVRIVLDLPGFFQPVALHQLAETALVVILSGLLIKPMIKVFPKFTAQENWLSRNIEKPLPVKD